jgi:hypothetical protein
LALFVLFRGNSGAELATQFATAESVVQFPITAFERSRRRGGRFARYARDIMLDYEVLNRNLRSPLTFLSNAKSIGCGRKKIQSPYPLARIHRKRQRPPSNGSIERAQRTSPNFTLS